MAFAEEKLQRILNHAVDGKKIFGTSFCVQVGNERWRGASGNLNVADQFFIASTTKLFTSALIFNLIAQGKLQLSDKISNFFDPKMIENLVVIKGKDYSAQITIQQLLAHTSGIADYFQAKDAEGISWENALKSGTDQSWDLQQCVERSKSLKARFIPGTQGKAHYSDTNFQLLGRIVEMIHQQPLEELIRKQITEPLGLKNTYLFRDVNDTKPKRMYFESNELDIPKAMISFGPDGGIVSTSNELMDFLVAFFAGKFFPANQFSMMQQWNKIFFPMESGVGLHRFKLPWFLNPFGQVPEMIGHSGLSGALAYFIPSKNMYITGTVNQISSPDRSFRLAISLMQQASKRG
jgi:CubicO group peptidase (beta-lactamase class C family)